MSYPMSQKRRSPTFEQIMTVLEEEAVEEVRAHRSWRADCLRRAAMIVRGLKEQIVVPAGKS